MAKKKEIIGDPIVIDGHKLSLSLGVRAGDFVFVSGCVAIGKDDVPKLDGPIEEQTAMTIEYIQGILEKAGCTLEDVVFASVFLKSRDDFPGYNEVYSKYFPDGPPARITVLGDFLLEDAKCEIQMTAYKPQN
ncbi:MAG: RidA family protein [Deltaproteobacteria bacterium]|nr:RidA family protein [Deltaproteobacteria bacterium]